MIMCRYLSLQIIFCFYLHLSHADVLERLWRRIPLSDILVSVPIKSTFTRSVSVCADICLKSSPVCKTFGYNKGDKSCLIFDDRVFAKGTVLSTSPGLRYYWTYSVSCPSNYRYYPSMFACLRVNKKPFFNNIFTNWFENLQTCVGEGGYLFMPHDDYKRQYIKTVITDQNKDNGRFCVSGGDTLVEGQYLWLDGTPINSTLWAPSQPDNYGGEDCSIIEQDGGIYKLYDDYCGTWRNYICEIPMK